jgi:hypothetical protein
MRADRTATVSILPLGSAAGCNDHASMPSPSPSPSCSSSRMAAQCTVHAPSIRHPLPRALPRHLYLVHRSSTRLDATARPGIFAFAPGGLSPLPACLPAEPREDEDTDAKPTEARSITDQNYTYHRGCCHLSRTWPTSASSRPYVHHHYQRNPTDGCNNGWTIIIAIGVAATPPSAVCLAQTATNRLLPRLVSQ